MRLSSPSMPAMRKVFLSMIFVSMSFASSTTIGRRGGPCFSKLSATFLSGGHPHRHQLLHGAKSAHRSGYCGCLCRTPASAKDRSGICHRLRASFSNAPNMFQQSRSPPLSHPGDSCLSLDDSNFRYPLRRMSISIGEARSRPQGNLILLFSDGEEGASFLSLQTAVSRCQQTNTAIYAFHTESTSGSTGTGTLAQLVSQTGGRVFRENISAPEMDEDLHWIEANLRNQYRLVYNPAQLDRDGTFHRIVILPPLPRANIYVRSGYYAPSR